MSRLYPALDIHWSGVVDDDRVGRILADVDEDEPVAAEDHGTFTRIFFASAAARSQAAQRLSAGDPTLRCEPVDVPDENWAERSQASLSAVRVGRITVAPPWAENNAARLFLSDDPQEKTPGVFVTIQPSMGFGTAHHASTRLCLRLLQDVSVTGARVLDAGTGSGVLAIAAARLGAATVLAVDNDPDALQSARENVALNHLTPLISLRLTEIEHAARLGWEESDGRAASPRFNVVLANLTGALLRRCAATVAAALEAEGTAIVSGVLHAETEDVTRAFEDAGLRVTRRIGEDEWVAFELRAP